MRGYTDGRALAITFCWVSVLALAGSTDVLLFLAPALLIAFPLFFGVYLGHELIARIATPPRRRRVCAVAERPTPPGRGPTRRPAGARLIAFSLAKRPPPLAPLLQS